MKKEIENLVNSLREGTAGKTCMGTGNYSLDVITQREYPEGFVVGKRNKFEEKVLTMEIGNTCGNVMTMLPYLGVKTFPVAFFDVSPHGYRMTRDMKAYGADVRFVSNSGTTGTTILRCTHMNRVITFWPTKAQAGDVHGQDCRHAPAEDTSPQRKVKWMLCLT